MKYRPAATRHDWTPHSFSLLVLDCCYNIFTNCRLMCVLRGTDFGEFAKHNTFFPLSESPMAITCSKLQFPLFISCVKCDFHAGLWDFILIYLLRYLIILLERIAVPFKRILARMSLYKLLICLTERSFLG